tara:strand:- start:1537 stop:1929 length:393 start_codon:yes stop_codon:yes gene_type:complete
MEDSYLKDRITPGIELSVIDMNAENFEQGARILLCRLLQHFAQKDFDPEKIKSDDLLLDLSGSDENVVKNLSANVCHHMQEIGHLTNPEIPFTPDNLNDLKVKHVVRYVEDMVNDSASAYVQMVKDNESN